MPNLSKDKIQKIVVSILFLILLIYGYFALLLNPINAKMESARTEIEELRTKVRAADSQIKSTQNLEQRVAQVDETMKRMEIYFPEGAPVAWFPPKMREYFKRQGISFSSVDLSKSGGMDDPLLDEYELLTWNFQLPRVDFIKAAKAIAGLENEQPFLEVREMRIQQSPDDMAEQRVFFAAELINRKD